jgi:hypothetical protein
MNTMTRFVSVPVSTVILSPSSRVEVIEETPFKFSCGARATRPAANIKWYKDGLVVGGALSSTSMDNLLYDVTSNLTSYFQRTDNGSSVYCTAVNIDGDVPVKSSLAQLNVLCKYMYL